MSKDPKVEMITFRTTSERKKMLQEMAALDNRSVGQMIEILIDRAMSKNMQVQRSRIIAFNNQLASHWNTLTAQTKIQWNQLFAELTNQQ